MNRDNVLKRVFIDINWFQRIEWTNRTVKPILTPRAILIECRQQMLFIHIHVLLLVIISTVHCFISLVSTLVIPSEVLEGSFRTLFRILVIPAGRISHDGIGSFSGFLQAPAQIFLSTENAGSYFRSWLE